MAEFKNKKSGHVINLGSIAGREPYAGGSIYCATKHAVNAFSGSLLRELVNTPIRVTEIQPGKPGNSQVKSLRIFKQPPLIGMVETEFSVIRYRGDVDAAKKVYEGLDPRESLNYHIRFFGSTSWDIFLVTAQDIAEEIVWAASRPPHVNIAEVLVFPTNQASAGIKYQAPK